MAAFLDRFAKEILDQTNDRPENYCVVLPNRRAGLFLKRYMAGYIQGPIWLPAIFSVEDFILHLSGMQLIDQVELLIDLYQVHKELEGKEAQSFDDFLNWGRDLIRDFNEIDQYMADPHRLFTYLSEAKALSVWNLSHEPLTPFQQKYLTFYQSLEGYYENLKSRLLAKGRVYQGLAYRKLAETIENVSGQLPWEKVFFGGFNAMTTAEERIIQFLSTHDQAVLSWDTDTYYMEDVKQEAGRFLRSYRSHAIFGPFRHVEAHFASLEKDIRVIGVPKNVGQAKVAGNILDEWTEVKDNPENTALVLINGNMLLPVLNSLPDRLTEFNITMGYPLKYTPVFDLIESVFTLQENAGRFAGLPNQPSWRLYYKDVDRLLNHPYVLGMAAHPENIRKEIANLRMRSIVFYEPRQLRASLKPTDESFAETLMPILERWGNRVSDILTVFLNLLEALRNALIPVESNESRLELEYIYHFSRLIVRLRTVFENNPISMEIRSLRKMIGQLAAYTAIPFYGEPLKGLQIMGMLETRNLDFENLILLSVNEGLLPASKHAQSFIPVDIRLEFRLPVYKDHDAVFAYHFYRLLQRAKKVCLLYNTEPTELGGGEQSRFITQIQHELPSFNPSIQIRAELISLPRLTQTTDYAVVIEKDEYVKGLLIQKADQGLSPSSLNAYRNCPLQFYFQYIAELPIIEEMAETIDAKTMGTVIHEVMKELFLPYVNSIVTPEIIGEMIRRVDPSTTSCFLKYYTSGDIHYGKNLLIINIAKFLIRNYLYVEQKFIEEQQSKGRNLTIQLLEEPLHTFLAVKFRNVDLQVSIKGTPDRIDMLGDIPRIIDYKTGNVRQSDLSLKSWEQLVSDPDAGKCFQVLLYGFLYYSQDPSFTGMMMPGIISFRTPSQGLLTVTLPDKALLDGRALEHIRDIIQTILDDVFDVGKPFTQTENIKTCQYCPYRKLCFR